MPLSLGPAITVWFVPHCLRKPVNVSSSSRPRIWWEELRSHGRSRTVMRYPLVRTCCTSFSQKSSKTWDSRLIMVGPNDNGKTVIDQIAQYSPDFKDLILHAEVRTPEEIENESGLTEGNIFHGELTMDQIMFNRPVPGYAQYRAPVAGLYMCGSSTHPGGGVMAAAWQTLHELFCAVLSA